jgi:hypothetical protein
MFDVSVQTDDPDITLADIDTSDVVERGGEALHTIHQDVNVKKRRRD